MNRVVLMAIAIFALAGIFAACTTEVVKEVPVEVVVEKEVVKTVEVPGQTIIEEVVIERDGEEVGRVRDGSMIGEMSFIQGGAATATVTSTRPCHYIVWPKDKLRQLLKRNPSMDIAMKHVFSMDLTRKLAGPVVTMNR